MLTQEEINEFSYEQLDELIKNGRITNEEYNRAIQYIHDCIIECETRLQVSKEINRGLKVPSHLLRFHKDLIPLIASQRITTDMYYVELERREKVQNNFNQLITNNYKIPRLKNSLILFTNFVVLSNVFKCNKNHHIEQIQATVNILNPHGEIEKHQVSAGYCNECGVYFILETDYDKLTESGILLCRRLTREIYEYNGDAIINGDEFNTESLLHQIGYNVNLQENLTSEQRQNLLKLAIDNDLYSISGLLSFLDWLIARNKKITTRDMSQAISKWNEDRMFIANYKSSSQREVGINSLSVKSN